MSLHQRFEKRLVIMIRENLSTSTGNPLQYKHLHGGCNDAYSGCNDVFGGCNNDFSG